MSFDLDSYRRTITPVRIDDLRLAEAFRDRPLAEEVLRCLRYMHDVESHTVCYLRDLLMTASHRDPRITTFRTMWNFEEYWHGVAIAQVLRAHGEPAEDDRIAPLRARRGSAGLLGPLSQGLASKLLGEDFIAVHMSWGAVNEWCTQAGYHRLAARAEHPVLAALLGRIARQESRHIAFYADEARRRLQSSARARRVTRAALRHLWAPVGSGVMPAAETRFLLEYLLDGPEGRRVAARIDERIGRLPGLAGMSLVTGALGDSRAA